MIQVYDHNNTNYDANGDITLIPTLAIFKMELNGICEIEIEQPYDEVGRANYLKVDNVIACPTPYSDKQLFRIYETERTLNSVVVYARHIFFDLADAVLIDTRPTDRNLQEALDIILVGTGFTGHSNIRTINTCYFIRKNIVEAIAGDEENSLINRYGGERLYDNFDVYINDHIGSDNGVRVEFGYNLDEIKENIQQDDVVTRIIPLGYDGIMLDSDKPWVDSPNNLNKYARIKTKVVEMSDIKVKESPEDEEGYETLVEAQQAMKKRCQELFEGGIDLPVCNYSVSMIDLASTTAYEDYKILETVNIGDTVHCKHLGLGIETKARCISIEWDILSKKYNSIELGDVTENFFDKIGDVTNRVEGILNANGTVKADKLNGTINALQTQFKAMKDVAQRQDIRAILFEDRDPESETFGAMCLGTMGFEIASQFKAGTEEWDWSTFGTGKGFTADLMTTGTFKAINIENMDGSVRLNFRQSGSGIDVYRNGKKHMTINGYDINFYNEDGTQTIGSLSTTVNNNTGVTLVGLTNEMNSALDIGYRKDNGNFAPYLRFDQYSNIYNGTSIRAYENMGFYDYRGLRFYGNDYGVVLGRISLYDDNDLHIYAGNNHKVKIGALNADIGASATNWLNIDKDSVYSYVPIKIEHTDGNTYNVAGCLQDLYSRVKALENRS